MRPAVEKALETLKRGRPEDLERALALLQDAVFSFSMKVCGHREDAEDTMQETLVKMVPFLSRFSSARALAVWLYKVAKNHCLMSRRKSKFAPKEHLSIEVLMPDRKELEGLAEKGAQPERKLLAREQAEKIRQAVLKLPPEYRLVIVLHDMEELTTEEIAKVLGASQGAVRVRLHRARVFVRNELAGRSATLPAKKVAAARPGRCRRLFAELSDYLEDRLDDSLCDELEKHLKGCDPCRAFLASLERSVQECRQYKVGSLPPEKAVRLRAELLAQYESALAGRPTK